MDRNREIREAIAAAEDALSHLRQAREKLDSAEGWGIWDMLGGGLLSTMVKHSRLDKAQEELNLAAAAVQRFRTELRDVESAADIRIESDGFLGVADFLMDGLLVDWLMQEKRFYNKCWGSEAGRPSYTQHFCKEGK